MVVLVVVLVLVVPVVLVVLQQLVVLVLQEVVLRTLGDARRSCFAVCNKWKLRATVAVTSFSFRQAGRSGSYERE